MSINSQGAEFEFFDPNQLSQSQFGVAQKDIDIAKTVLAKFRAAAQS
jgi:hypothetical protein